MLSSTPGTIKSKVRWAKLWDRGSQVTLSYNKNTKFLCREFQHFKFWFPSPSSNYNENPWNILWKEIHVCFGIWTFCSKLDLKPQAFPSAVISRWKLKYLIFFSRLNFISKFTLPEKHFNVKEIARHFSTDSINTVKILFKSTYTLWFSLSFPIIEKEVKHVVEIP